MYSVLKKSSKYLLEKQLSFQIISFRKLASSLAFWLQFPGDFWLYTLWWHLVDFTTQECHLYVIKRWTESSFLSYLVVCSSEYLRKNEKATTVLPDITWNGFKKSKKWFIWTLKDSRLPGNTIVAFSSLRQYSLLVVWGG